MCIRLVSQKISQKILFCVVILCCYWSPTKSSGSIKSQLIRFILTLSRFICENDLSMSLNVFCGLQVQLFMVLDYAILTSLSTNKKAINQPWFHLCKTKSKWIFGTVDCFNCQSVDLHQTKNNKSLQDSMTVWFEHRKVSSDGFWPLIGLYLYSSPPLTSEI